MNRSEGQVSSGYYEFEEKKKRNIENIDNVEET